MGKHGREVRPTGMSESLTLDHGSIALAVHLDLATYGIKCPYCGAPLNLAGIDRRVAEPDETQTSAEVPLTVIEPAVCPECGHIVVYG